MPNKGKFKYFKSEWNVVCILVEKLNIFHCCVAARVIKIQTANVVVFAQVNN